MVPNPFAPLDSLITVTVDIGLWADANDYDGFYKKRYIAFYNPLFGGHNHIIDTKPGRQTAAEHPMSSGPCSGSKFVPEELPGLLSRGPGMKMRKKELTMQKRGSTHGVASGRSLMKSFQRGINSTYVGGETVDNASLVVLSRLKYPRSYMN